MHYTTIHTTLKNHCKSGKSLLNFIGKFYNNHFITQPYISECNVALWMPPIQICLACEEGLFLFTLCFVLPRVY